MPSSIASAQHQKRRCNSSPRAGRRIAVQDEMLPWPCGTIIPKSSYRTHRYRSLQHVDYNIAACIERNAEIDARQGESRRLQRAEAVKSTSISTFVDVKAAMARSPYVVAPVP